jgi:nucleoside 2-deoxyribosyltransferase
VYRAPVAKRVYLAGPDVFFKNVKEHSAHLKEVCAKHGLEGLFPLDADVHFEESDSDLVKAHKIFVGNVALIHQADGVLANMVPFRGPSMDLGTAWEMGLAYGLGKPVVAFTDDMRLYHVRVEDWRAQTAPYLHDEHDVENFGLLDNLMPVCGSACHAVESFEAAVVKMVSLLG